MQEGLHALIGTCVMENGAPLAYAAVGTSGSEGREERSRRELRENHLLSIRKKKKKSRGKQVGAVSSAGGGQWLTALCGGNEMIIGVVDGGKWTAIVALTLGVIIDFLLC